MNYLPSAPVLVTHPGLAAAPASTGQASSASKGPHQASACAHRISQIGTIVEEKFQTSISSLFEPDARSIGKNKNLQSQWSARESTFESFLTAPIAPEASPPRDSSTAHKLTLTVQWYSSTSMTEPPKNDKILRTLATHSSRGSPRPVEVFTAGLRVTYINIGTRLHSVRTFLVAVDNVPQAT